MPSSKKEDKSQGKTKNQVFKSPNMSQSILSFLSFQDLAATSTVSKQFQEDTQVVKEREEKIHINDLKQFLKISEKDSVYHLNDYRQLLICQSVIKSLQQMVDNYLQHPENDEFKKNALIAVQYLLQSPLSGVVAKCISQCICDSKETSLALAEKMIAEANNSNIILNAIRDCVYYGGRNAATLAEKLINKLSPEEAKLLNEIPKNQTETILTKCIKRNWLSTASLLLDCKTVNPTQPNRSKPPQTPFRAAIQVSCESNDLAMLDLILNCQREDLRLKTNENNILQTCMAEYDRLDHQFNCAGQGEKNKFLKQLTTMGKIMVTLVDHGFAAKQPTKSITKRIASIFNSTSTPASKFIKKYSKSPNAQRKLRGPRV